MRFFRPSATFLAWWLAGIALAAAWLGQAAAKDWNVVTLNNRQYVTDQNVASFYGTSLSSSGKDRIFNHPNLQMKWTIGVEQIYVNNVKFNLSFPVAETSGMALLSVVDLAKLIDPVVRPSYIKKPIPFEMVVVDPGHGGHDPGAKGRKGLEKDYNLDLSIRLAHALQKLGFKVVMTRQDDRFLTLGQRVAIANSYKRAIFISIHHNSGERSAMGVETFALPPQGTTSTGAEDEGAGWTAAMNGNVRDAENIALATAVHAHVIHDLAPLDRGVKRARFHVLSGITIPAILYEGGFLTNSNDAARIHDAAYRQRTAETIANAVMKFKMAVGGTSGGGGKR